MTWRVSFADPAPLRLCAPSIRASARGDAGGAGDDAGLVGNGCAFAAGGDGVTSISSLRARAVALLPGTQRVRLFSVPLAIAAA